MLLKISEKAEARIFAQIVVLGIAISYVLLGALVFLLIDEYTDHDAKSHELPESFEALRAYVLKSFQCVEPTTSSSCLDLAAAFDQFIPESPNSTTNHNSTAGTFKLQPKKWTYAEAILYVFTLITTIGYGNIVPGTFAGKVFTLIYGAIGIPLAMLVIANIGKFVAEGVKEAIHLCRTLCHRKRSQFAEKLLERSLFAVDLAKGSETLVETDKPEKLSLRALLLLFIVYITIGTFVLPCYENMGFFTATYFCFISITTVGFGDVSPQEMRFLIPTLLYITGGLAITTISLDLSGGYLRQLHHMGKKLADVRHTLIHFGAKTIAVGEFTAAVAKSFQVPDAQIHRALKHLDEFVIRTIDQKENPRKYPRIYQALVDNPELVFKLTEKLQYVEADYEEA